MPQFEDTVGQSCAMVSRWRIFGDFFASCIFGEPHAAHFRHAFKIRTNATPCVVNIQSVTAKIRRGKKKKEQERTRNHRTKI